MPRLDSYAYKCRCGNWIHKDMAYLRWKERDDFRY